MFKHFFRASVLVCAAAVPIFAGDSCCTGCGCRHVREICVPVREIVRETTYEYCCVCEDICVPGPSKCVGTRCEPDCAGCPRCVNVMQPTCGGIYTRHVLLKKPVVKEKCVTKWVVKKVCCGCDRECGSCTCATGAPPADVEAPTMPSVPTAPMPPAPPTPPAPSAAAK
jgi:hypothetical protein